MSIVTPDQLHVNAVAKTPKSVDELAQAKSELEGPSSKAFTSTKLTTDQEASVLDLCARYRPVFALSMSELGLCTCLRFVRTVPSCLCLVNVRAWSLHQRGSNISFTP